MAITGWGNFRPAAAGDIDGALAAVALGPPNFKGGLGRVAREAALNQHADCLRPRVGVGLRPLVERRAVSVLRQAQADHGIAASRGLPRPRFLGLADIDRVRAIF